MTDQPGTDDANAFAPSRIDDPRRLRALSHPVRLRLLAELATRGAQNVRMLAERVGEPANSVSYHLSQLASHGLVVRVEGPEGATRRERWYEASSPTGYQLVIDEDTPDQRATVAAMKAWMLQVTGDLFDRYLANEPEARRRGLPVGTATTNLWLTDAEAREVGEQINALLLPLARRVDEERRARREGSELDHEGRTHYTLDLTYFPDFSENPMIGSIWSEGHDEIFTTEAPAPDDKH